MVEVRHKCVQEYKPWCFVQQLVENGARGEVLREENRALSRRLAMLEESQAHTSHLHHWKVQCQQVM